MLPLLWPRIAWRVSSATPAARSLRPYLVSHCALTTVEPGRVVDTVQRLAAVGEYRSGVLATTAFDDRACDRVQHADMVLVVLPGVSRDQKHSAVQLGHRNLPPPIQPHRLALAAQSA